MSVLGSYPRVLTRSRSLFLSLALALIQPDRMKAVLPPRVNSAQLADIPPSAQVAVLPISVLPPRGKIRLREQLALCPGCLPPHVTMFAMMGARDRMESRWWFVDC